MSRRRPLYHVAVVLALLASECSVAQAQPHDVASSRRALQLVVENDLLAIRGRGVPPDYDYSHGTRVSMAWDAIPLWLRTGKTTADSARGCRSAARRETGCHVASLTIGQAIYTPRQDAPTPVPGERPYAGWLYATATTTSVHRGDTRTFGITIGVTGATSLAQAVQDGMHRVLHNQPQLGWAHQIPSSVGVAGTYSEAGRRELQFGRAGVGALRGQLDASLGTLQSQLGAAVEGMLGLRGQVPWNPASPDVAQPPRAYLLGVVRQDWVLRDALIEGRGTIAGADRRPLVSQAEVGVGYRWRSLAVEYRHVVRGREYRAQPAAHAVGSIRITALR